MATDTTGLASFRTVLLPLLGLGLLAVCLTLALRQGGLLQPFELEAHDWALREQAQRGALDDRIVVIGMNDADLAETGYPIPDGVLSDLLTRLLVLDPIAIGVDILRDRPVPPGTDGLNRVLRRNEQLLWATTVGVGPYRSVGPPEVLRGGTRTGAADQLIDPGDQIVRRGLLYLDDGQASIPTFPLQLAVRYLLANNLPIGPAPDQPAYLRFGPATVVPFEANDGGYVGADADGYQYLMRYPNGPAPFPVYSYADVLAGDVPPDALKDRIVLVGYVSEGLKDFFFSPFTALGDVDFRTPGVVLHALQVQHLIDLAEARIEPVSVLTEGLEIVIIVVLAAIGIAIAAGSKRYWLILPLFAGVCGIVFAAFWFAMAHAVWIPPVAPVLALLLAVGMGVVFLFNLEARRRRQEELARVAAEAATAAKSAFLATVSHEIRTPMNGVIGMLELMQSYRLDGELKQLVGVAHNSAQGLLGILNDILDSSKIEAGKLSIEAIAFPLSDIVDGVGDLLAACANEKGLELLTVIDPQLPVSVIGDPTRLRQIVTNLASNAVKFTEVGRVTVRALSVDGDPGSSRVRFEVADTGIGLSPEQQGRLFQPFAQADESTTRKFGGTGLGLSICRSLVELMDGTIGVESEPGKGSVFYFEIPLPGSPDSCALAEEMDLSGLSAVVVSQNDGILPDVTRQLAPAQVAVVSADLALDAVRLEIADADTPVPVIVDMLSNDAINLLGLLNREGLGKRVSPLFLARQDDLSGRRHACENGFVAALAKPARTHHLRQFVASAAGRARPLGEGGSEEDPDAVPVLAGAGPILIIDDIATNRMVAQRQFGQVGLETDLADGARAALEMAKHRDFDLIFVDLSMPEVDGFMFAKLFRAWEQDNGRTPIPVISMSGFDLDPNDPRLLDAGISGTLSKPASLRQIADTVRRWLPEVTVSGTAGQDSIPAGVSNDDSDTDEAPGEAVPIDLGAMREALGEDSEELIDELLEMFGASMRDELLPAITAAAVEEDRSALRDAVHAAKGISENVSADALAADLKRLEAGAAEADWEDLQAWVATMEGKAQQVIAFIDSRGG